MRASLKKMAFVVVCGSVPQPSGRQRPAADAVPVPTVPVLQEGARLPRLPGPVLPGRRGQPRHQEANVLDLLQEGTTNDFSTLFFS